nr:reverse transcriptase domain-containing protein [Tanacetum cinerariifolium]
MATLTDMMSKFVSANIALSPGSGTLPSNTITNPKEELKGITTRSGVAYQGPKTPSPSKQGTKVTKNQVQTPSSQNTAPVQPSVIQSESQASVFEPVVASVSAPMPNLKPSIPYPSRRDNEKCRDQANEQIKKFYEISTEMIPGMDECLALADLGASINLRPVSVWEGLSLPELTPTCMTLELANRSVSKQIGIAKDVSFKVGVFHFPTDFVVVDFEPNLRVPLILGRCFLKTSRALIDVHKGELTLHVTASGTPIPHNDPIVSATSPTLTSFGDSDFLLFEEADAILGLEDDPDSLKINPFYYDPKGNILLLEAILNSEPSPPLPNQEQNLPSFKEELKAYEAQTVKSSVDEPPEVELKDLPPHLEYIFLEGDNKLPVIIAKELGSEEKSALIKVLKSHKRAIAWKLSDIQGINPEFCTHKILMEEDYKPAVQHQRRVNLKIHDVIKKEVKKLLDAGLIYPISDSPWVSPVHCVPKKGGFTVVENEENKLIPTRLVTGWRVCIDYRKLNEATRKDHFPLPFMDQMLERLVGNEFYCFLDGFFGYFQIPIDSRNQEKTTFTCPYGTFSYRRMPFSLCNAPGTFQRFFGNSFENCLSRLDKMLQRCEDTNLSLNWKKIHFMVKESIVLGHKISKNGIEVDRAKIDVIAKLPHPTTVKGIQCFLGHAGIYRRFIQDFSKISRPMTHLLEKNTPFIFSEDCIKAFQMLKKKLTEAPILIAPNWDLPFELMCDASDFAIENLAANHLSRLESPYENVLDPKEINETFPLEMLSMVTFRGDSSAPWYEDTNLCLNWEKSHFMVKEGIVLGHKISKNGVEVDKAKVDVISKLPHPITVKGVRSFLGQVGFYQRFIQDFFKISRPMTQLLEKNTLFIFSEDCIKAFQMLKKKLTEAPILIAPNWDLPFELMCDASDFAIGAVLGQRH